MKYILFAVLILVTGCASVPENDQLAVRSYLFPHFKPTPHPEYILTAAERKAALRELWDAGGDILYELIIDEHGKVVKSRVVKPWRRDDPESYFTIGFLKRIQQQVHNGSDRQPV